MAVVSEPRLTIGRHFGSATGFLLLLPAVCLLASCGKRAQVTVTPSTVLLDPDEPGAEVALELLVRNTGSVPIVKVTVQPSCACAVIASSTESLPPEGNVRLTLLYTYPAQSGKFRDMLLVVADHRGKRLIKKVPLIGETRRTIDLRPTVISADIGKRAASFDALLTVMLLDNAKWVNCNVAEIVVPGDEDPQDLVQVMLQTDKEAKIILGRFHCDTGKLRNHKFLAGFIRLKAKSTEKDYNLRIPFKLVESSPSIRPHLLTWEDEQPVTARISLPVGVELEEVVLRPGGTKISTRKELRDLGELGKEGLIMLHLSESGVPYGFKFGVVSFKFSDGSVKYKTVRRTNT